jgi:hypothetical protein
MQQRSKWILHTLFVAFIVLGIAMKRFFGHPEWLPPFHIAALIVLIAISVRGEARGTIVEEDAP